MGNACCKLEKKGNPNTDTYDDKLIKFVTIPVLCILGLISLCVLYLVDKVKCYPLNKDVRSVKAEDYCFNSFRSARNGSHWTDERVLMHKFFPVLLLCEALSLVIMLVMWHFWIAKDLSIQIRCVIDYCNNLTDYYRKYEKGMRMPGSEQSLHIELDNYLEFLAFLLMKKSKSLYFRYLMKCVSLITFSCAWFTGYVVMFYPTLSIFEDYFYCLYEDDWPRSQMVSKCSVPTSTFLRASWYISMVLNGLHGIMALVNIIHASCCAKKYTSSFFHRTIPGTMDSRLADIVQNYFNPKHFSFISKHCLSNCHLCKDFGLSRSLARKFGVLDGFTPGRETIMDKHFPVIQPEQIKKFRISAENFSLYSDSKNTLPKSNPGIVRFVQTPKSTKSRVHPASVTSHRRERNTFQHRKKNVRLKADYNQENYMPSRLLARKLEKEMSSPRSRLGSVSDEDLTFNSTPRSIRSVRLDNSFVHRSPGQQSLYGSAYGVNYNNHPTRHYPVSVVRNRELNPFAYKLDLLIKKNVAANLNKWKP